MVDHQPAHVQMNTSYAPETSCRRSTREKQISTRYSPNENIILTDMEEPKGYDEVSMILIEISWLKP